MQTYQRKNRNYSRILFFAIFLIVLTQNWHDLSAIMRGGDLNLSSYEGPIILKIFKDILYLALFSSSILLGIRSKLLPLPAFALLIAFVFFILFITSALNNDVMTGLIGLRWSLPFLTFLAMRDVARFVDPDISARWLLYGMLICVFVQIYQLFYMPPVYGEIFMGLAARTPGIFLVPNSTAFFASSAGACIICFANQDKKLQLTAVILAVLISLLAQSGTGIIVSAILFVLVLTGGFNFSFIVICFASVLIIFLNLNAITMREDYVAISGGTRLDIFFRILSSEFLSIDNFGIFTNTAVLDKGDFAVNFVPDSLWASWFGNLGFLSLPVLLLTGMFVVFHMHTVDWYRVFPCVLTFFLFSMTTIVFEAFPMNLYLSLGIWKAQVIRKKCSRYYPATNN